MLLPNYQLLEQRTIGVVVSSNLIDCVRKADDQSEKNTEELLKEAVNLLIKSR
jgi:hypothetical protein